MVTETVHVAHRGFLMTFEVDIKMHWRGHIESDARLVKVNGEEPPTPDAEGTYKFEPSDLWADDVKKAARRAEKVAERRIEEVD